MLRAVGAHVPMARLAMHFHDTYGQALANLYAGMDEGVHVIDSAAGGLGGCPFAPGATGNVATEDVVYMLARISHAVEAHRGANQRKLLCSNDFSLIHGAPRCRQSVAQNGLILEWWKAGLWKRPLMLAW
jgi:hydroxymethylglutaryl-CoA lyase